MAALRGPFFSYGDRSVHPYHGNTYCVDTSKHPFITPDELAEQVPRDTEYFSIENRTNKGSESDDPGDTNPSIMLHLSQILTKCDNIRGLVIKSNTLTSEMLLLLIQNFTTITSLKIERDPSAVSFCSWFTVNSIVAALPGLQELVMINCHSTELGALYPPKGLPTRVAHIRFESSVSHPPSAPKQHKKQPRSYRDVTFTPSSYV